jgi:hypothetical protein
LIINTGQLSHKRWKSCGSQCLDETLAMSHQEV